MASLAGGLRWSDTGASICCGNPWDVTTGEYSDWNDGQTTRTVRHAW